MLKFVDFSEAITIMANDGKVYMDSYTYGIINHLKQQKYVAEFSEELTLPEAEPETPPAPETPEKPVEAVAETPEAPKKAKKRPPFDYGKLGALMRAGWPVKKIADDMGVSDQTIYNHIAEMKKMEGSNGNGQTENT